VWSATAATWQDRFVTYRANARREAIRQVAEPRTRLDAAEDVLTAAETSLKQAHTRFDAADDQVAEARTPYTRPTRTASKCGGTATPPGKPTSGPAPSWNGSSAG
jgi:hypothetical protein